tara:strand:- start:243 stop:1502 length:1260 start_codon:yes stop_codon:yes gene_type:complete
MANRMTNGLLDYFGDLNVFGAGPDATTQSLLDAKLITPEAIKSANKRSIGTGIMTGIASYLAQPKNQNYGSVVPYLGKAYLNANEAAQSPFQGMTDKYLMDTKIAENQRVLKTRNMTNETFAKLAEANPDLKQYLNMNVDFKNKIIQEMYTQSQAKPTYNAYKSDEDVYKEMPDGTEVLIRKGTPKTTEKASYTNAPTELFVDGKVVSALLPTGDGLNKGLKPLDVATGKPIESAYTVKPKPLTESQGENKQHSTKMGAANAIFTNQLENQDGTLNYDPLAVNRKEVIGDYYLIGDASAAILNKYNLSPQDRQASQAKKIFINSILRKESGAAIAQSEFDNADSQYFPQYGDDQQTIINKRITRDLVTKTMAAAVNGDPKAETEIQQIIAELSIYKPPLEKKPRTKEQKALLKKYREGE